MREIRHPYLFAALTALAVIVLAAGAFALL